MSEGRYIGVDVGTRRVGLAVAGAEAKMAKALTTVSPDEVNKVIDQEGPFLAIIVGLPRGLSGQDTPQTLAVRRWVDDAFGKRHEEIVWMDEAGTSALAEDELMAGGKPYDKAAIDAQAAAIILQDYLDQL